MSTGFMQHMNDIAPGGAIDGSRWLGARGQENDYRSQQNSCRKKDAAVAINFLGAFRLLIVVEDRRHQSSFRR